MNRTHLAERQVRRARTRKRPSANAARLAPSGGATCRTQRSRRRAPPARASRPRRPPRPQPGAPPPA
eukprot:3058755-Alexandrium_andersonii.AAC.1